MIEVLLQGLILGVSAMVVVFILTSLIKIVREHERGVIFRLGHIRGGPKGPGLVFLIPFVNRMVKIDLGKSRWTCPPRRSQPATTSQPA